MRRQLTNEQLVAAIRTVAARHGRDDVRITEHVIRWGSAPPMAQRATRDNLMAFLRFLKAQHATSG
jgi:hypothetical protein